MSVESGGAALASPVPRTRKLALKSKKKLKRGRHTLTANARDAAGNGAKTLKKRFKVG